MARKPTGRPRGRPRGSRQYPADDLLRIEMARLILNERAKNAADAARQVAPRADGPNTRDSSKARRLLNDYKSRERWFITQAQARPGPVRRGGVEALIKRISQQIVEQHELSIRMADALARGPGPKLITEFSQKWNRDIESQQRHVDSLMRGRSRKV
jgi:hypothetical protein